jgi:two-component system competent response regulator ComA
MISILLVDDHPSVMEGTKLMLEKEEDIDVSICGSAEEALGKITLQSFDVMLFDLNMPRYNGIELTKKVLELHPDSVIVIFTGFDISPYFNQLIDIGVTGFVQKTATREHLVNVIRCAIRGDAVIPLHLLRQLSPHRESDHHAVGKQLSAKDMDILREVARGKSNKDIASLMLMSQRSLEYALTQLFQKLQVKSRVEAVAKSKELGVILEE